MIVKAIAVFKEPMSCPPYSTDPLNVNCIPPWPRRPKHTSQFVVLTDSSEKSCFYRLPIEKIDTKKYKSVKDEDEAFECIAEKAGYELSGHRTFWYIHSMQVTNDTDCPPQFVGSWSALFEYIPSTLQDHPWWLRGLLSHGKECEQCGAREVGDAGDDSQGRCHFKQCGGCEKVQYCNITCQKKHWIQHKTICRPKEGAL